jgi:hypothetical protein
MTLGDVFGIFGIVATVLVGAWFYVLSDKIQKRIEYITKYNNAVLIARMSMKEYKEGMRLINDIINTGEKRGTLVQRPSGTWGVDWIQ